MKFFIEELEPLRIVYSLLAYCRSYFLISMIQGYFCGCAIKICTLYMRASTEEELFPVNWLLYIPHIRTNNIITTDLYRLWLRKMDAYKRARNVTVAVSSLFNLLPRIFALLNSHRFSCSSALYMLRWCDFIVWI